MHMERYSDAIIYYNETQDFYWENNENIALRILQDSSRISKPIGAKIIDYKKGFAQKKLSDPNRAKKHDLQERSERKQLLSGHDLGRNIPSM